MSMAKSTMLQFLKNQRALVAKLLGLALAMDIFLWVVMTWFKLDKNFSFDSPEDMHRHLVNMVIYISNSLVAVASALLFLTLLWRSERLRQRTLGTIVLRKGLLFILLLVTSWLLSILYLKIGFQNIKDTVLTTVSLTFISFFIAEIFSIQTFYKMEIEEQMKTLQMESDLAKYKVLALQGELASMRLQTDSHFIYNCFNHLIALFHQCPEQAEDFMLSLSRWYRYLTMNASQTVKDVASEVGFLEDYLNTIRSRFPGCFTCEIDENLRKCTRSIPILSLQILAENVFNHNAMSKDKPIRIMVKPSADGSAISFSNDKHPRLDEKKSTGQGLKNLDSRLSAFGKSLKVEENDTSFTVIMPII